MSKMKIPKQYYIKCDICGEKITNSYFNKRRYYEFIVDVPPKKPFKTRTLDICSQCYMQMEYWIQRRRDKDKKED